MNSQTDFERLQLIFRRSLTLPELQGAVYRLINAIDSKETSVIDLERIISSDPYLTANLLRVAAGTIGSDERSAGTLRNAIMRLGFRAMRSLAVSILLQSLVSKHEYTNGFDPDRFARHSLFVGFMSRYLFARRHQVEPFDTDWTADEVFAAGLLHDMAAGLLAHLAPESFQRVYQFAHRSGLSLEASFTRIFGARLGILGSTAAAAWNLPEVFVRVMSKVDQPWEEDEEYTALCCIHYANHVAHLRGVSLCPWNPLDECPPEVELEVKFPAEEIERACEVVERHTAAYLEGTKPVGAAA
ncbi:MAG TPA: HDOD domain-containing protein [Fimbriimonadaceae bacterium]|nr:HDOD domain-containing protein [Fimbriimonadaceae bacterium]